MCKVEYVITQNVGRCDCRDISNAPWFKMLKKKKREREQLNLISQVKKYI